MQKLLLLFLQLTTFLFQLVKIHLLRLPERKLITVSSPLQRTDLLLLFPAGSLRLLTGALQALDLPGNLLFSLSCLCYIRKPERFPLLLILCLLLLLLCQKYTAALLLPGQFFGLCPVCAFRLWK